MSKQTTKLSVSYHCHDLKNDPICIKVGCGNKDRATQRTMLISDALTEMGYSPETFLYSEDTDQYTDYNIHFRPITEDGYKQAIEDYKTAKRLAQLRHEIA